MHPSQGMSRTQGTSAANKAHVLHGQLWLQSGLIPSKTPGEIERGRRMARKLNVLRVRLVKEGKRS